MKTRAARPTQSQRSLLGTESGPGVTPSGWITTACYEPSRRRTGCRRSAALRRHGRCRRFGSNSRDISPHLARSNPGGYPTCEVDPNNGAVVIACEETSLPFHAAVDEDVLVAVPGSRPIAAGG